MSPIKPKSPTTALWSFPGPAEEFPEIAMQAVVQNGDHMKPLICVNQDIAGVADPKQKFPSAC